MKLLLKPIIFLINCYQSIRYLFGPKVTVGRKGLYKTMEEALEKVNKRYTTIKVLLEDSSFDIRR